MRHRVIAFAGALAGLVFIGVIAWFALQMVPAPARPAGTPTAPATGSARLPSETPAQASATAPAPIDKPGLGKVAFVQGGNLWVKALPDGEPLRLTTDEGNLRPRWSPSGAWLTFEKGNSVLWLVRADGTGAHAVADVSTEGAYAWSPVDDVLAFVYAPGQICLRTGAALAGESSTGERCVTLSVPGGLANPEHAPETISDLTWSPDGSTLAFVREWGSAGADEPGREYVGIWTLAVRGNGLPVERYGVTKPERGIQIASSAPGGHGLLFWQLPGFSASIAADGLPLWGLTFDGQVPVQLPYQTLAYADYLAWSSTPEQLALILGTGRQTWANKQLAWLSSEATHPVTLTDRTQAAAWPTFSPDGARLAYVAMPASDPTLGGDAVRRALTGRRVWIADLSGKAPARVLVDNPTYRDERPEWSADGTSILFARFDAAGKASLWLVPSTGGQPRMVVETLGGTAGGQPVPDWFGFYGYVDWDRVFSWWRGPAGPRAVPTLPPADRTPLPTPPPVTAAPGAAAALTVEEYPIVAQGVDTPSHFEYSDRISDTIRMTRAAWREAPAIDAAGANAVLARFSYRLVPDGVTAGGIEKYQLCRGETLLLADVTLVGPGIGPVAMSASGADFAFLVEAPRGQGVGTYLVRAASAEPWDEPLHAFIRPVFVGDDLVAVERTATVGEFLVRRGRDVAYTFTAGDGGVENPVKALWEWEGHWVLEVSGQVFVDGQSLNQQLGYDAVFGWQLVGGQPFYFFQQAGRVGVSYAGTVLPYTYDDVVHYRCCEPAVFNVAGNGTMAWFHALRDGIWYYVEAGVYESQ
jgi:TolB protein